MSIVKLNKLTFCGLKTEKVDVLKKLQVLGGTHLISLNALVFSTEIASQKQTEKTIHALKYLTKCANKRHQVNDKLGFNLDAVVQQVSEVETKLRDLSDQRDFLINRINEVKPWGDFKLVDSSELGGMKCWFYIIPKRLIKQLNDSLIYQVVHEDNIHFYVVVLAENEPSVTSVPVPRTHAGTVPLSQLYIDFQEVELALEDTEAERESLTRWITLMTLSLTRNEDINALKAASSLTLDQNDLFAVQAWVPVKLLDKYTQFAENNGLAILVEEVNKQDRPPTLLENSEYLAGGEDVIKFYQTPAYNSWDPSVVVFFSFAFFFAMILSDAGYASVFAILLAAKWKKLGRSLQGTRLRMLAAFTLVFSLVWGVMTGGYFGYSPEPESLAGFFKVIDLNDFDSMMQLSIIVGVIHIILANLIKAYQFRETKIAFASIGWVCLVSGGFLLWIAMDGTQYIYYSLLAIGCLCVLFFSGERELTKPVDYLWQILDGLKNITGITKIFGDILSYMRLFALGLASASLALTFNQLAEQVYTSVTGMGLLLSILILIIGHALNLILCLMSGVVHGLRLNFIEFYSWSVSDEGYAFKVFSKKGK